jgi:hypothetical protein
MNMQGYFHGEISREDAEQRLGNFGLKQGAFLVRAKDFHKHVYALSVSSGKMIEHHLIQVPIRSISSLYAWYVCCLWSDLCGVVCRRTSFEMAALVSVGVSTAPSSRAAAT